MFDPKKTMAFVAGLAILGLGAFVATWGIGGSQVEGPPSSELDPTPGGQESTDDASPDTQNAPDGVKLVSSSSARSAQRRGLSPRADTEESQPEDELAEIKAHLRRVATPHNLVIWPLEKFLRRALPTEYYVGANQDIALKTRLYRLMEMTKISIKQSLEVRGGKINELGLGLVKLGNAHRYAKKPKGTAYLCEVDTNGRTYKVWLEEARFHELRTLRDRLAMSTEVFVQNVSRELHDWRKRR